MNFDSTKNQELIKKFPFLNAVLAAKMEPFDGTGGTTANNLTIKIEKADGDLMYRRASNTGLGDNSFVFSSKDARKNQVMRSGEYVFAINAHNRVINQLSWPRNGHEQRKLDYNLYAYAVLWATRSKDTYSNPLWDKTEYLVWVTVEAWHMDTKKDNAPEARFGNFCDRSLDVTIYTKPKQGFEKLQKDSSVYENLSLTTSILEKGVIKKDYHLVNICGMLYEMCVTFQDEVYFNGMKKILDDGKFRGASGEFGPVKVLAAEMCGYDRVTLEDKVSYVTFQLHPDSEHMYVLGQQGTLPQIRNLVRTVVKSWNTDLSSREVFKSNSKVSVI